jgi:hypothetical protein
VDVEKILQELRDERDRLVACILALQRLSAGTGKRGRPTNRINEGDSHVRLALRRRSVRDKRAATKVE